MEFYEVELADEMTNLTFERLTGGHSQMRGALAINEDGIAVGMVNWLTHPGTWAEADSVYLEDLFVSKDARGTGAGRALIQHVDDWGKAHGAAKVYWLTAESNKTAQQLYDRMGKKTGFSHYQIND